MLRRVLVPFFFSLIATHGALAADAAALWSGKVQQILDVNCVKCHGVLEQKSGLELDRCMRLGFDAECVALLLSALLRPALIPAVPSRVQCLKRRF